MRHLGGNEARECDDEPLALAGEALGILQRELCLLDDLVELCDYVVLVHFPTRCEDADARYQIPRAPCEASARLWPSSNTASPRGVGFAGLKLASSFVNETRGSGVDHRLAERLEDDRRSRRRRRARSCEDLTELGPDAGSGEDH